MPHHTWITFLILSSAAGSARFWNNGREQAVYQLMAPDALIHGPGDEISG